MRKWLLFGFALAAAFLFTKLNTKKSRERHPRLKRIDQGINIVVVVVSAAYLVAFVVWLINSLSR